MTRVCLVGTEGSNLQYELLSRETSREALATYDMHEPFENAVGVETVSLGSAVSLLNDLDWYLTRFVEEAMVLEPSVSETEWLSRTLAAAIRDDEVSPEESARFLKIYGVERPTTDDPVAAEAEGKPGTKDDARDDDSSTADPTSEPDGGDERREPATDEPARLVEPMFVTRTGDTLPDYDLRDVEETVVERVTESEFGA